MRKRSAALGSTAFLLVGPGSVLVLIPLLITGWEVHTPWWSPVPVKWLGGLLLLAGVVVVVQAFVRFVLEGIGTPVPSAPPQHLVVGGLYRWVRNPMYVALLTGSIGQALLFGQWGMLVYCACVWAAPAVFVRFREEPVLARRFGAEYERYQRHVRAWIPRIRPWDPGELGQRAVGNRGEFG